MPIKSIDIATESTAQDIYDKVKDMTSGIQTEVVTTTYASKTVKEYGYTGASHAALVNNNGKLYCVLDGGSHVLEYRPGLQNFLPAVCDLPYSRIDVHEISIVSYNGEIHLLGGSGDKLRSHYKLSNGRWEVVSELPFDFSCGKAVVFDGKIHIIGGGTNRYSTASTKASNFNEKHYAWDGKSWTQASIYSSSDMTAWGTTLFVFGNELHLIGGGTVGSTNYMNQHWMWDKSKWVKLANLPFNIFNASAVTYTDNGKSKTVIAGGNVDSVHTTANRFEEIYTWDGTSFYHTYSSSVGTVTDMVTDSPYALSVDSYGVPIMGARRLFKIINGTPIATYSINNHNNPLSDVNKYISGGHVVVYKDEAYLFYNGGSIYKLGKNNDTFTNVTFTNADFIRKNFHGAAIASADDGIHVIGSDDYTHNNGTDYTKSHLLFDGTKWTQMNDLPFKFIVGSAIYYKGKLHIVGGYGLKNSAYNHYMLDGSTWVPVARTPYDVYGNFSLAVIGDYMYAIAYIDNLEIYYLLCYNGFRWSVVNGSQTNNDPTRINVRYESYGIKLVNNCRTMLLAYRDRIYTMKIDDHTDSTNNAITYKMFMSSNGYINSATEYLRGDALKLPKNGTTECTCFVYNDCINIISSDGGSHSNLTSYVRYTPSSTTAYKMYIPKGHKIICDKNKFYPISDYLKEIDDGYEATRTDTHYIYSDTNAQNAYTIY